MNKVRRRYVRALAVGSVIAVGVTGLGVAGATVVPDQGDRATTTTTRSETVKPNAGGEFGFGLRLGPNERAWSGNGKVYLIQQLDGNLVLRDANDRPLWHAQTHGNPGARTYFQHNGNLVVLDKTEKNVLFYSSTREHGHTLAVQNDGNLVIYNKDHKPVWSSQVQATTLYPGQILGPNQYRESADGRHRLYMQGDGNLIIGPKDGGAVWSTGTHGHPGAKATVQVDGNIVVLGTDGAPLWASDSHGHTPAYMTMQNDGNVVLYGPDRNPIWASNTSG